MTAAPTILTSLEEYVYTITLNRPEQFNAANEQLTTELLQAIRFANSESDVRCVVIKGAGKAFCSGQDLKEAPSTGEGRRDLADSLERRYNPIIRGIREIPKPVIAAINGVAAGAGLSIALATDIRVMSTAARLVEAFIGIALIPDSGATFFYPRIMGYSRAFEFAVLNKPINADEALNLGLVSHTASPGAFEETVLAMAKRYAQAPTRTVGYIKELLQRSLSSSLNEMLDIETMYQQLAGDSDDYKEGVDAFIEKRPPLFTGR